ncbi:hypothetical protein XPA_000981 [Xanthoria parietina]
MTRRNSLGPNPPHARHNYFEEDFPAFFFVGQVVAHPTNSELNGLPVFMKRCGTKARISDVCRYFALVDSSTQILVRFANVLIAEPIVDEMFFDGILSPYDIQPRASHCKILFNLWEEDQAAGVDGVQAARATVS